MRRKILLLFPLLALLTGGLAFGQKPDDKKNQSKSSQQEKPEQIHTLNVRLPITVKEKDDCIAGLTQANFEVYEDGKRQKIETFESPSTLPLNIALLVDTSNSVKLKLPVEKEAAEDFVVTVTTFRRKDQVLFATFDSEVVLHQDFTDDSQKLVDSIRKRKAGGVTRLYDAVYRVIEEKMATLRRPEAPEARLVMLVISDGSDTASDRSLKDAIAIAQQNDVTIFGISTKNFSGVTAGVVEGEDDKALRQLCESTGGQIFLPSQKVDLFRSFSRVKDCLRQEYVVYYTPQSQERSGKYREIKVKLINADGKLYHKKGYTY
ncbi:MAG TPA: VWA domain-containing protein [Blastocatellia bacterium]